MERGLYIFRKSIQLFLIHHSSLSDLAVHGPFVAYGLDYISCSCLTLRPDESCTLGDTAQSFTKITRATDERNFKGMLIDMVFFIGGSEDFRLVDIVYTY